MVSAIETLESRLLLAGVSLDPTFGGGRAVIQTATAADLRPDSAATMLVQPDGKILIAGTAGYLNGGAGLIVRLNADGSRDTAFGSGSETLLRYGQGTSITAARLQPDGKLVLAGTTLTAENSIYEAVGFVTRLNADGSLDTSFGDGGSLQLNGVVGTVQDMLVLPTGKLLVTGTTGYSGWDSLGVVARLSADGTLDTTFGTGGRIVSDQKTYTQTVETLVQLTSNKVLALTSLGIETIDPVAGIIGAPVSTNGLAIAHMLALPDGNVAAIGVYTVPYTIGGAPVLARLTPAGVLDTTFGNGGMATLATGSNARYRTATSFVRQSDGSFDIWLSGSANDFTTTLLHVSATGIIDTTFAQTGSFIDPINSSLGYGNSSPAVATALDIQGRLISTIESVYGPRPDGTNVVQNIVVSRYLLDMGLTPQISVPTVAMTQGNTFNVSAAGTTSSGLPIINYQWDANYTPGGTFTADATGLSVSLKALAYPSQTVGLRITTSDGASAIFTASLPVADAAPTITPNVPASGFVTQSVPFNFSVTDPGTDTYTVALDPGNGSSIKTYTNWTPTTVVSASYTNAGNYTAHLTVTDAGGLSASTAIPVTIQPLSGKVIDTSAGNVGLPNVTVFIDTNGNGILDTGETSVVTDSSGNYVLPSLFYFGSYQLGVVPPTNYYFAGISSDLTLNFPLSASWNGNTIKLARMTSISGVVYNDQDGDGIADNPAVPIAGATVWLDLDNDGLLDNGEPSAVTSTSGSYTFALTNAGTYTLRTQAGPTLDTTPASTQMLTIAQYQRATGVTLLAKKKQTGTLNVVAYLDANGNGIRDAGEVGIPSLSGQYNYPSYPAIAAATFTTGTDGTTVIAGLPANDVTVALNSLPYIYAPSTDNGAAAQTVTIPAGQTATVSFGLKYTQPFGTITGRVFNDINGNGIYDAAEPYLNLVAYDDLNNNGQLDLGEPSAENNGTSYTLNFVPPGVQHIRVVNQSGYIYPGNDAGLTVSVAANQVVTGIDLGIVNTIPLPYSASILGATQVAEGQTITLEGSGQSHNEPITGFQWDTNYVPGGPFTVDATGYYLAFGGNSVDGPGTRTIAGRSVDQQGRVSDIATFTIGIVNVPPTATLTSGPAVAAGSPSTVDFSNATDPSTADLAGLTFSYDFNNDGDFTDPGDIVGSSSPTVSHTFASPGTYTIHGRVSDKDGGYTDYTTQVIVNGPALPAWVSPAADANCTFANNTLNVFGGTVIVTADAGLTNPSSSIIVGDGAHVIFTTTQHLGNLTLNGAATASLAAGGGKLLRVTSLSIGSGATLDLNNNDLIYDYTGTTPQANVIAGFIHTARAGGAWTGYGLTSTVAENSGGVTTLGYMEASDYKAIYGANATFDGEALDTTAVIVKYTLYGDADLDGSVSINDFNRLATDFGAASGQTFDTGDFDLDGSVSINDFNLLAQNFGKTLTATGTINASTDVVKLTPPTPATPPPPIPPAPVLPSPATGTGSITGNAFNDNNTDAKYDTGDGASKGITVFLDTNNNGILDAGEVSTTTDSNGKFTFVNLGAGTYQVRRVFDATHTYSTPLINVTLTNGQAVKNLLLGTKTGTPPVTPVAPPVTPPTTPPVTPPTTTGTASITGTAFNDNNSDGKYDTGDGASKGITLFLDTNNDGILDDGETSVLTDINGRFTFSGLSAGTYHVRRVMPSGYTYSTALIDLTLTNGQAKTSLSLGTKKT